MSQKPTSASFSSETSKRTTDLAHVLERLNHDLKYYSQTFEALKPSIRETLHSDEKLPEEEAMIHAARSVDLLHKIQLQLDPPVLVLADHFLGYVRSKCLSGAVQQRVPDALSNGPLSLNDLARATQSHSDRLGQAMQMLCTAGIFDFDETTGRYSNSLASCLLRSDHWTQWHNWVTLYGDQFYNIARGIPESLKKDSSRWAAQINYDTDEEMFSFFQRQGWVAQLHQTLGAGAAAQMPGILEDYPWHEVDDGRIIDIGGGSGAFIVGLARKHATVQGAIFDVEHVIDHIRPFFQENGPYADVRDQFKDKDLIAGDFFVSVPPSAVYTMKWCLHDWKDPQAVAILKRIRDSIVLEPKSRLIVLESVLSTNRSGRLSQYGNINMMMTANGQERTENEWRLLAGQAGWHIKKTWNLRNAWVKALDFRPMSL